MCSVCSAARLAIEREVGEPLSRVRVSVESGHTVLRTVAYRLHATQVHVCAHLLYETLYSTVYVRTGPAHCSDSVWMDTRESGHLRGVSPRVEIGARSEEGYSNL